MRNFRRISQGIFLLLFLFLFLQTEAKGRDELGYPVKLFLDFDPLILITTVLSAHTAEKAFFLSGIVIAATVFLGRVFCGWVCPLGTLNNIVGSLKTRHADAVSRNWHRVKYYVLIFLLASSLLTVQLTGIMDPISLLIRSLSLGIYPAFHSAATAVFDGIYHADIRGLVGISESVYSLLKKSVLAFQQPLFSQGALIGALFLVILGLNLVERRFWCRYLCPLGALLGLLSRFSLLRRSVSEGCASCGACASVCQGGARPDVKPDMKPDMKKYWQVSECYSCRNCDDACPKNAVSFGFGKRAPAAAMDLGRRQVLASAFAGIAAVPLLRTTPLSRAGASHPGLVRPPGSREEREFLKRCVRCGECMKVCITNGLQPTLFEAGPEGIWSPMLVPRIGYCEYRCTLCGQVCPTGAIRRLELKDKAKVRIGTAMIDKGRCLPHAHATPCIVCEEVCPTPKKAIWFDEITVRNRQGEEVSVKQPRVDLELCIGCGICETKCPLLGRQAIYVTSIGESRSKENQLLMNPGGY